jgi:hypothetical protein
MSFSLSGSVITQSGWLLSCSFIRSSIKALTSSCHPGIFRSLSLYPSFNFKHTGFLLKGFSLVKPNLCPFLNGTTAPHIYWYTNISIPINVMASFDEKIISIAGFPGYALDVDRGVVVTETRRGSRLKAGEALKWNLNKKGYPVVWLYKEGVRRGFTLHKLFCEAFHGGRPSNIHSVNHIDGNKLNWHPSNLEWVTHKENMAHSVLLGLHKTGKLKKRLTGEGNNQAKLTEQKVLEIRAMSSLYSHAEIAERFGISQGAATMIINRQRWKHVGGEA